MIIKSKDPVVATDRFEQAGAAAEEQMAFYLRRAFAESADVAVFNDIRLVVGDDCAQIDHLVQHPFGLFIIESKSVCGEVEVNEHGEWIRKWGGQRTGMPSPIQQARRQAEFLRALLNTHAETLRDKRIMGLVPFTFTHCPIDVYVAISDRGIIRRHGTHPPEIMKADLVCDRVREEMDRHRRANSFFGRPDGAYGLWKLNDEEVRRVHEFLLTRHTPRQLTASSPPAVVARPVSAPVAPARPAPGPATDGPSCKHCGSDQLLGTYGKYGYYFKCTVCEKNTPIDYTCTACGKKGRIRKQGAQFIRSCEACGREEPVWVNPPGA